MDPVAEAALVASEGLEGSVDRSRRRQITVLELGNWQRSTAEVGSNADPSRRRANIVVNGIALAHTGGRVLRIGNARLAVGGELTPCERMDEVPPGLQAALRPGWRAGVFAQLLDGGVIRVGDALEWEPLSNGFDVSSLGGSDSTLRDTQEAMNARTKRDDFR